jgi:hypothetical protein
MTNALHVNLSDKYASGEASEDNCDVYLSFCEANDTLPRTTFTVYAVSSDQGTKLAFSNWR